MRYIKHFIILLFVSFTLQSCDRCYSLECAPSDYIGQFRIVSASDGKDLLFGPTKTYDLSKIRFYGINAADTIFFECKAYRSYADKGYDSVINVYFFPKYDTITKQERLFDNAYMRLSNGDIDTFKLSYNTVSSKCCGTQTNIVNYRFNNSVDIPGGNGVQEIKK